MVSQQGREDTVLSRVPDLLSASRCEAHSNRSLRERSLPDHVNVGIGVKLVIVRDDVQSPRKVDALWNIDARATGAYIERPRLTLDGIAARILGLDTDGNGDVEAMGLSLRGPEHSTM